MPSIKAFIARHPVWIYFALVFAISWGGIVAVFGPDQIPASTERIEKLGPFVYLVMLAGPALAGILMTGLVSGRAGLRELLSRLLRRRVGLRWYAIALLATPLLATIMLLALSLVSPEFLPGILTTGNRADLLLTGIVAALMVGVFEEIGWTGFAIPRLRLRYGVLATGLIVGLAWGAWHFIAFWQVDSFTGAFPVALLIGRLFTWLPAYRVLMVLVYDRTGSLLVSMLMHASLVSTTMILVPLSLSGVALLTYIGVWAAALWVIATVATSTGRRLNTARAGLAA